MVLFIWLKMGNFLWEYSLQASMTNYIFSLLFGKMASRCQYSIEFTDVPRTYETT